MKIYICHSKQFDFKTELYVPIRNSALNGRHEFIFPHETDEFINSKDIIKSSDLVIAEISYPNIGEGIELGWADDANVPVVCIYREGGKVPQSLSTISSSILLYNPPNVITVLEEIIKEYEKRR